METNAERNANVEQARAFVAALNGHVEQCSAKIEDVETRSHRSRTPGQFTPANNNPANTSTADAAALRAELYEIHRQLDRLHAAFPELTITPRRRGARG